jgi:prephenate dehydratase
VRINSMHGSAKTEAEPTPKTHTAGDHHEEFLSGSCACNTFTFKTMTTADIELELDFADAARTIAFQGAFGAYSDLVCRRVFPDWATLPCAQFEDAFAAVREDRAALAMIPIENSVAGRVADIHHLMPGSALYIIGEQFERVNHHLLAVPGASLQQIRTVKSHVHALSQCRNLIRALGVEAVVTADTAGAAAEIAALRDPSVAAIASELAGRIYGLVSLKANIEDAEHNTTRFLIMSREPRRPLPATPSVTTFLFRVRNVPAALYKTLGGFATNGINMTKLESYMVDGAFTATQFYADVEAHPLDRRLALALEELAFFSREVKILGVYPAHPLRLAALAGEQC